MGKTHPESHDLKFVKGKKNFRLTARIAGDYRTIAATLGVDDATLTTIEKTNEFPSRIDKVFNVWLQNANQLPQADSYPLTWDGLRELLKDSDLANVADEYFEVLEDL